MKTVALMLAATVCGCGLTPGIDDGDPSIAPFVEVAMANGDVFDAPQARVWAYHDVPPQRWGRHSDLMLSLTIEGTQRSYTVLINIPPGQPDETVLEARWSVMPSSGYTWVRLRDRATDQVFVAESGTLAVHHSFEDDGAEYVRVTGSDFVLTDECGASMTMSSFRGALRVGQDALLNKFTPEQLADFAFIANTAGDGSLMQLDGARQYGGDVTLTLERGSPGSISFVSALLDACGTQLGGAFSDLPYTPSSQTARSSSRIAVSFYNPANPDGDLWFTDQRTAYTVEHWPSGPGDYMTFELAAPITIYKGTVVLGVPQLDRSQSRQLQVMRFTADVE